MERREESAINFHSVYNASILGYPTYRPVLSYRMHRFFSMPAYQRQLLERTRSYIRMFCAGLMGFIFVLLLCLTPFHWVQFTVLKDKKRLLAGLWTLCHNDLCWSHTPEAPWFLSGFNHISFRVSSPDQNLLMIPITRTRIGNIATVELGLSETNVGVSPWMSQVPERQLNSVAQSRTQREAGTQTEPETQTGPETQKALAAQPEPETQAESRTQTEPEIGNESVIRDGLITQARLATEIEPVDTVKPRPEAEITTGNETSDMLSNRLEGKEKKMTEDRDDENRDLAEKNDDDKTKN
ncbi:PREDICTED: uncharacterized protein LOC106800496 [Ceratotherium simum simum]|uniref:Uncharacterized protein LOC106800496 n=1 Tax=Ceratotherium simum simum TaxID=73337 RepID=A0ABM1C9Z9_CERSS|nr:PREDICTED: uncharacterized protein LOC106800496 [Ceratotherium simum simum]